MLPLVGILILIREIRARLRKPVYLTLGFYKYNLRRAFRVITRLCSSEYRSSYTGIQVIWHDAMRVCQHIFGKMNVPAHTKLQAE